MFKRSHYIAVGLVALLTLLVLNLPGRTAARLKLAMGSFFLPLFGLASGAQQATGKAGDAMLPRSALLAQNESLRRENQQLRVQAMQLQELTYENARLRKLVGWQQQTTWKFKLGNVVLREPANWWRAVQIDLGSRDGVRENLPVLTMEGLVGRIGAVGLTSSQVVLLGDPGCSVSALVENETHDMGVIGVSSLLDNSVVEMSYLSRNANLKPGQTVVTSGVGGIFFKKGIVIGKIADARLVEYGLYTQAHVKLAANLSGLEEVWVLFP